MFDPLNGDLYVPDVNAISIISGTTNALVSTMQLGQEDATPTLDPTNGDIYVPHLGNSSNRGVSPGGTLSVISGSTNEIVADLQVGLNPATPLFDPLNGDIYVPDYGAGFPTCNGCIGWTRGFVSVVSGQTNSVIANLTVGYAPKTPVLDPSNGNIYVLSTMYDDSIFVISGSTNSADGTIALGGSPSALAFDNATGDLYVSTSERTNSTIVSSIVVISGSTNTPIATIRDPIVGNIFGVLMVEPSNGEVYCSASFVVWVVGPVSKSA